MIQFRLAYHLHARMARFDLPRQLWQVLWALDTTRGAAAQISFQSEFSVSIKVMIRQNH